MRKKPMMIIVVFLLVVVGLSGCNESNIDNNQNVGDESNTNNGQNKNDAGIIGYESYEVFKSVPISGADLSGEWPLTVESGYIDCYRSESGAEAWFFRTESGELYYDTSKSRSLSFSCDIYCRSILFICKTDPNDENTPMWLGEFEDKADEILLG